MYRKMTLMMVFAALIFALGLMPALAQANGLAYLYNGVTKELLRVNPDGTQASYNLGLDENTYVSSYDMAFTDDGARVAFCAVTFPQPTDGGAPAQSTAHLYLRDIASGTNTIDLELGNAIGCRTGHEAFNDDGTQLAVSRINYFPGDPAADASLPTWQLMIVDANSGATLNELNSGSPAAADFESLAKGGVLPYVQSFSGTQLIFAEVPYAVGGGAEWNAYTWDTAANTLTPVEHWGNFTLDRLGSSGEMVWVTADPNLPGGVPFGEMPANNVVQATDASGEVKTIYHSPDWIIVDANFINGGQQVAIELLPPADPNAPDQPLELKWVTLDRSGQLVDLVSSNGNPMVEDAPGGYVVLNQTITDPNTGMSTFSLTTNTNGQSTDIWSSQNDNAYWELAWVTPSAPAQGLQPFTAVSG